MFRPRVIPVLLLGERGLVKSRSFTDHRYVGDAINAVRIFNELAADELVFLDILATREGRHVPLDFVREVGEEADMPFAVGGGIRSVETAREILKAGAEKIVIGAAAVDSPGLVEDAAATFGSSSVAVCIDCKELPGRGARAWTHNGTRPSEHSPEELAQSMEARGAGELIIQSIARDGAMRGYDLELTRRVSAAVAIPVVALGGAGSLQHMADAYNEAHASALAAGSLFVFQGASRGVLINYPERSELPF